MKRGGHGWLVAGIAMAALVAPTTAAAQQPIEPIGSQLKLTAQAPADDADVDTENVDVAYNSVRNEYLIVWANEDARNSPTNTEIFGRRLDGNGTPIGNAFQISGHSDVANFDASDPSVAFDPERNRYAVAFLRDFFFDTSKDVFVQAVTATGQLAAFDGAPGPAPLLGSVIGFGGNTRTAAQGTDIVYRPDASGDDAPGDAFIVAYAGDHAVENQSEVLLSGYRADTGAAYAVHRRASNMKTDDGDPANDGDGFDPSLTAVPGSDDVVVAWTGHPALAADDEIFVNRIPGTLPVDSSASQRQISSTAPTDASNDASEPSVTVNPDFPQFLVAFRAQRNTTEGPEIRIQRVDAGMNEIEPEEKAVSSAGPADSGTPFSAGAPSAAWHPGLKRYLVTWIGEDDGRSGYADDEVEVTGTVLTATGVEANPQDFPISRMGRINDDSAAPASDAVAVNTRSNRWLSVWTSDEPQVTTADGEFEVFGRGVAPNFDRDYDGVPIPEDCNDANPGIRPGAGDAADNGVDEDCAGGDAINPDRDGDGSPRPADCDDGNPFIKPGATEVAGNGLDEDCAGGDGRLPTPRITVSLSFDHLIFRRFTRFPRLQVKNVPRGSTVKATCKIKKRKCPGKARKPLTVRQARGIVSLNKRYQGVRLPVGATITVTVTKPGFIGAVKILKVRAGPKRPKVIDRCLPLGARRPQKRC